MKIDRRCPKCKAHRKHWLEMPVTGRRTTIQCAECGHKWTGRIFKRDYTDDELKRLK